MYKYQPGEKVQYDCVECGEHQQFNITSDPKANLETNTGVWMARHKLCPECTMDYFEFGLREW